MSKPTVLVISDYEDVHADAVIRELNKREISVLRLHVEDFPESVSISIEITGCYVEGEIATQYHSVRLTDICSVWFRRSGTPRISKNVETGAVEYAQEQAQITIKNLYAILNNAHWINSPFALQLAEMKALQLVKASQAGLMTPSTLISNDPRRAALFREQLGTFRCAIKALKPVGAVTSTGWRFPFTKILPADHPLDSVAFAPIVFQLYVEKLVELRCVVFDENIFPFKINSQLNEASSIDWRAIHYLEARLESQNQTFFEPCSLPESVAIGIRRLMRSFNIKFASLDMIITPEGEHVFLDLNPNGQWLWLEQVGVPLSAGMADLLTQNFMNK